MLPRATPHERLEWKQPKPPAQLATVPLFPSQLLEDAAGKSLGPQQRGMLAQVSQTPPCEAVLGGGSFTMASKWWKWPLLYDNGR